MKRAENIQNELNELGAEMLMKLPAQMPFALPYDYFNQLNNNIKALTTHDEAGEAHLEWPSSMPFEKPSAAYFDNLSNTVLAKVRDMEPEWSKVNPYAVPSGYFEQLPGSILNRVKTTPAVKKRIPLFHTVRLAAAMALIFFVGFSVLKMNHNTTDLRNNLSGVSQSEINEYVAANLDDFDTDLIINTLAKNDVKEGRPLEISDAEIKAYLDETGWN